MNQIATWPLSWRRIALPVAVEIAGTGDLPLERRAERAGSDRPFEIDHRFSAALVAS
jgi:hypothetical protein